MQQGCNSNKDATRNICNKEYISSSSHFYQLIYKKTVVPGTTTTIIEIGPPSNMYSLLHIFLVASLLLLLLHSFSHAAYSVSHAVAMLRACDSDVHCGDGMYHWIMLHDSGFEGHSLRP